MFGRFKKMVWGGGNSDDKKEEFVNVPSPQVTSTSMGIDNQGSSATGNSTNQVKMEVADDGPVVKNEHIGEETEDITVTMAIDAKIEPPQVDSTQPNISVDTQSDVPKAPAETDDVMVAMTIDEVKPVNSALTNKSVDPQKDALKKFVEENPEPSLTKDSSSKIPAINPPQQQEIVVQSAMVNSTVIETGRHPVAPTSPVKPLVANVVPMETEVPKTAPALETRMVRNRAGGAAFKVCDMNRLRRYIVLGTEHNTYYSTPGQPSMLSNSMQNTLDNIQCLKRLLLQNRHQEVLDTITEYSLAGRVAKETPILTILALCADHENLEVQKAAYAKVAKICNIPTKLFKFLDLTQTGMEQRRKKNPPQRQKIRNDNKRKRVDIQESLEELNIKEGSKQKHPCTNDETSEPVKKKVKKRVAEFKKVDKKPKKSSGWGRMRRKALSRFYEDAEKDPCRLLYLLTKYKHRHNWSHKELIAYCHPKMIGEDKAAKDLVVSYCLKGYKKVEEDIANAFKPGVSQATSLVADYIKVLEEVNKLSPSAEGDEGKLIELLKKYGVRQQREDFTSVDAFNPNAQPVANTEGRKTAIQVVREHIPTGFLNSYKVWEALLTDMPMTALIRNLGKMSSMKLFHDPKNVRTAVNSLTNVMKLKLARIHPLKILIAMKVYEQGHGEKSEMTWPVNREIVNAMDQAFYKCFRQPEVKDNYKTGLKYMLCLDVSGSMTFHSCVGCDFLTPAVASTAMAWVTWNVEDDENVDLVAFGGKLEDMKPKGFRRDMLIAEAMKLARRINFGSTDCSLPMVHALEKRKEIDVFIVYTDSDTWAGRIQPVTALRNYNREMKRNAKLVVCGMESTGFTIADPQDPNMMDIVGFDDNVPELISEFAKGNLSGACSANCTECDHKAT